MTVKQYLNKSFDSKSFEKLTPVMKEAINDIVTLCNEAKYDKNTLDRFDNIITNVCKHYNIERKSVENYFDNELNELIGEK